MNNPDWASEGQVFGTCEVSLPGHRGWTAEVVEMTLISLQSEQSEVSERKYEKR